MANRKSIANKEVGTGAATVRKSRLLIVPLAIALLGCIYFDIQSPSLLSNIGATLFSPSFLAVLITPSLPVFLVAVFCCLAMYLLLTNRRIGKFETVIAWIFAAVAICFLLVAAPGIGRMCGELSCATTNTFSLGVILLMNPFADLLWNILAIIGSILLVRKLR